MEEQDIKDKISKGAEELFMRYGIRSISMDDIARHLSVSKKTLYQHFADKDELVLMVSRNYLDRNKAQFESIRDKAKNLIEELVLLSACVRSNMESINPSLLYDLQKFYPKAWAEWIDFKNKHFHSSVVRIITNGVAEGYVREGLDPEILAVMRIECVQMGFNPEIFPAANFNFQRVQEQLFEHFVHGIVTEKGRKLYLKYKELNKLPSTVL
jgi:AcrR family transcriptional regulator